MAHPDLARRGGPCPVCGQTTCKRFPDMPSDATNPFLGATAEDTERAKNPPPPPPKKRPKGKRHPAEDRARHLKEDR